MAEQQAEVKSLSKSEKAAVVLLMMDEQATAELFEQMQDEEIRKVASALIKIQNLPTSQVNEVMQEFASGYIKQKDSQTSGDVVVDGYRATQNLLSRSLTRGRSQQIMSSIRDSVMPSNTSDDGDFIQLIQKFSPQMLHEIIKDEHPQIIALTLINAKKKVAREVLEMIPEDDQGDILSRMARVGRIPGRAIEDLRSYFSAKLKKGMQQVGQEKQVQKDIDVNGLEDTVRMLKRFKRDVSTKLVEQIEDIDDEIGDQISKLMFTIEDLERADDVGIRDLLRGITNDDLKVALKESSENLREKIFGNMSERAAMILREDMDVMGPLKVEEIEAAQQNILKVAKQLIKEEKLTIAESDDAADDDDD